MLWKKLKPQKPLEKTQKHEKAFFKVHKANKINLLSIFIYLAVDTFEYKIWRQIVNFRLLSNEDHNLFSWLKILQKFEEHGLLLKLDVFAVNEDDALDDAVNGSLEWKFSNQLSNYTRGTLLHKLP